MGAKTPRTPGETVAKVMVLVVDLSKLPATPESASLNYEMASVDGVEVGLELLKNVRFEGVKDTWKHISYAPKTGYVIVINKVAKIGPSHKELVAAVKAAMAAAGFIHP